MLPRTVSLSVAVVLFVLLLGLPVHGDNADEPAPLPPRTAAAWTLKEATEQLELHPRDPYLQYVVMQLARREGKADETANFLDGLTGGGRQPRGRRAGVDLFSIFTGALAVQESLQLDTMRGERPNAGRRNRENAPPANAANRGPVAPPVFAALAPAPAASALMLQPRPGVGFASEIQHTTVTEQVTKLAPVHVTVVGPDGKAETIVEQRETTVNVRRNVRTTVFYEVPVALTQQERDDEDAAQKRRRHDVVKLSDIKGPEIKGHPWKEMLAGQKPAIDPLAKLVPEDFYFVQFRSLSKLLETAELSDLWGTHAFSQAQQEARSQNVGERLRTQLALETNPLLRPFLDLVVDEVAVTGSDLFIREGSDVTLVVKYKQPALFKSRLDGFIANAEKAHPDAKRTTGEHLGVKYDHLRTPDRAVCVYSAYPIENVHVRSNSLPALQRVIEAIRGKDAQGQVVRRLGDSDEFAYIRTLYPRGAKEEDGLIYLSDPFIRRLVGPQVKLTERRRMLCYNHLRMIGHGAMMFRTEFGKNPTSLDGLFSSACCPYPFRGPTPPADASVVAKLIADLDSNQFDTREKATEALTKLGAGAEAALRQKLADKPPLEMTKRIEGLLEKIDLRLACPDGGTYTLGKDGLTGACSHHGHAHFVTPNLEIPLREVTGDEADEYRFFLNEYNQYWRTFFDPIAVRIQAAPERYRLETLVLPLIDNSIYTALARAFGGKPADLDAAPVPKRNIFSINARMDKDTLLRDLLTEDPPPELALGALAGGGLAYHYLKEIINEVPEDTLVGLVGGGVVLGVRREESIRANGRGGLSFLEELGASMKSVHKLDVLTFLRKGIGNEVGLHVCDSMPIVDVSLPQLFGLLGAAGGNDFADPEMLLLFAGVTSLTAPVYVSLPVRDAAVVDRFGDQLEVVFAEMARKGARGFLEPAVEFYTVPFAGEKGKLMRVLAIKFGPLRLRYFWARIGETVYIASKQFILDDLLALHQNPPKPKPPTADPGHLMVKLRPQNWDQVLQDYRLGWAENQREACLHNHGPLSSTARAFTSHLGNVDPKELEQLGARIQKQADHLHQVHFYCPDGGKYILTPDARSMTCSVHGSVLAPRQPIAATLSKQLAGVKELTATLTFLPEGLRAVVVIERK